MPVIYEPDSLPPSDMEIVPNTEIILGLRAHFHAGGISFGLIDPSDSEFSVVIDYERVKSLLRRAAMENSDE